MMTIHTSTTHEMKQNVLKLKGGPNSPLFLPTIFLLTSNVRRYCLERPPSPSRVQLVRATTTTLEVCWGAIPTGEKRLLWGHIFDSSHLFINTATAC